MLSISPICQSLRNNPLASASTVATIVGVAAVAIGVLALVGIIPGISGITAICLMAVGGTIAIIGISGVGKGLFLTNKRWHNARGNRKPELSQLPVRTGKLNDLFKEIEYRLLVESEGKEGKASTFWTVVSTSQEGKKVSYYCLYDSRTKEHDWYQIDSSSSDPRLVTKKDASLEWSTSNIVLKKEAGLTKTVFLNMFEGSAAFFHVPVGETPPSEDRNSPSPVAAFTYVSVGETLPSGEDDNSAKTTVNFDNLFKPVEEQLVLASVSKGSGVWTELSKASSGIWEKLSCLPKASSGRRNDHYYCCTYDPNEEKFTWYYKHLVSNSMYEVTEYSGTNISFKYLGTNISLAK